MYLQTRLEGNKPNVCLRTSLSYGLTLTVHLLDGHFMLLKKFNRWIIEPTGNRNPLFENCQREWIRFFRKTTSSRRLLKFGLSLSGHEKWLSRAKRGCQSPLVPVWSSRTIDNVYASHARVITVIIQTNFIHLSIKMTMPHQSGAPFVGERVFQNRGVCGQAFPSFPSPTPSFTNLLLPHFSLVQNAKN